MQQIRLILPLLLLGWLITGCPAPTDDVVEANHDIRSQNQQWVQSCLNKISLTKTQNVRSYLYELCRKPNYYYGNSTQFDLVRSSQSLMMQYRLHLVIQPETILKDRADQLLKVAQSCIPLMQAVWQRYKIDFDLVIDSNFNLDLASERLSWPEKSVYLFDKKNRSNAGNFYYDGNDDRFCRTLLHETGHHLGLEDEYADESCPDRPLVDTHTNPFSIMAAIEGMPWEFLDFYPRHIQTIFADYCEVPSDVASSASGLELEKIILDFPPHTK